MSPISDFIRGFLAPLRGLQIIFSSSKNFAFAVLPFIVGLFFVVLFHMMAADYLQPFVDSLTSEVDFFASWPFLKRVIDGLIWILSWILISMLNFLAAYLCIVVVAGPFYALMVENIFKCQLSESRQRGSLSLLIKMFFIGLLKVSLFAFLGLICFVLAFFPGLNLISAFVVVLLVAFDCADYAFEVDLLSLRQRFDFLLENFWVFSGLSFAILATGLIPGAFFLLLPAFICGATKIYIQSRRKSV